jgi:hypothetical protein
MAIEESPYTLEWIKSNEKEKTEILWLKSKAENFVSLHPLQLEISQVCKFHKAHMDTNNLKWEDETWPGRECHK